MEEGFSGLVQQTVTGVNNLNISLSQTSVSDINSYLTSISSQSDLRVFIAYAQGFGHQASSVNIIQRMIQLGYTGTVEVVYDSRIADKLTVLLPGYQGLSTQTLPYMGTTLKFTPVDIKSLPKFEPKTLG